MTDDRDRRALVRGEPGDDRRVVGVLAITVNLDEIGKQEPDVVERVGTLRMTGHQSALPRRQPSVHFLSECLQPPFKSLDFVGAIVAARYAGEFLDFLLQLA